MTHANFPDLPTRFQAAEAPWLPTSLFLWESAHSARFRWSRTPAGLYACFANRFIPSHQPRAASRSVQSWAHTAGWARVLHGNTSFQLGRRSQHASQGAAWGHGCMGDTCLGKVSLRPVSTQKQRQEISQRWGLTGSLGTQSSVTVASPSFPGVTPGSSPTMPCQEEYPFLN